VDGTTVDSLLRKGPVPVADAVNYVTQILDALEYAHSRGVIHRDIKPGNIMVTPAGVVKLMDFGIAKLSVDRKLTMTGRTLGSLHYMSPEQIQGAASVDARSDIYSLGICLYEMATGKRPFAADSDYALMVAHLEHAPTPPIEIDPKLPPSLSEIILLSIRKDPGERFQSAAAFRAALGSVVPGSVAPAPAIASTKTVTAPLPQGPPQPVQPACPAVPPPAAKSRRGLYMALGSVVTVGIIAAAITVGPRFFGSKHAAAPPQVPVQAAAPQPAPANPQPLEQPIAAPTPAPEEPVRPVVTPGRPPVATAAPARVQRAQISVSSRPPETAPLHLEAKPLRPADPPPPNFAPAPRQTAEAPLPQAAPDPAALNEIRERYNQLAMRAGVAHSGLQSLQNQMGGLGLRADMREAAVRLDYLMQEARTALASGNTEAAKRHLEFADRVIERIEKFLGR
jgi:serine/threonine-protein kinase